jgi:FkbM family methyltransferase
LNWIQKTRVKAIQVAIHLNEAIFFYPKLRRYYRRLVLDSPVILDVGSNKGQSISFFRQIFRDAHIFGFEPNPVLFERLKSEWHADRRVFLCHAGVSNQQGKLSLQVTVTDETSTFEPLNPESSYLKMKSRVLGVNPETIVTHRHEVAVLRLSDFIREQALSKIHILKIDTEGHEYKCLVGLFADAEILPDYIQLEVHEDDMYVNREELKRIPELLSKHGYRQDAVINHGFGDFYEVIYKRFGS